MDGFKRGFYSIWETIRPSKKLKRFFVIVCGVLYIKENVFSLAFVNGSSMEPTFNPSDEKFHDIILISKKINHDYKNIRKNDIIIFKSPVSIYNEYLIKRLININGEVVKPQDENYRIIVPPGHVWVEGDNKLKSCDSRHFGPISLGLVVGKPFAIIWPPSRIQLLKSNIC